MAIPKVCSIDGCGKTALARGWCGTHYKRWQEHGSPSGSGRSRAANGEPQRFYREVVLQHDSNECLPWPYARTSVGYGHMFHNGRDQLVSRLVCEERNGPPPTPEHEATHSCGKGHEACCAKRHLVWKTHVGNMADTVIHDTHKRGERCNFAKLTEAKVRKILSLKGSMTQREIGNALGVTGGTVSAIHRKKNWAWLT